MSWYLLIILSQSFHIVLCIVFIHFVRMTAEDSVKAATAKFNWIEQFPATIIVCDETGVILLMNEAARNVCIKHSHSVHLSVKCCLWKGFFHVFFVVVVSLCFVQSFPRIKTSLIGKNLLNCHPTEARAIVCYHNSQFTPSDFTLLFLQLLLLSLYHSLFIMSGSNVVGNS